MAEKREAGKGCSLSKVFSCLLIVALTGILLLGAGFWFLRNSASAMMAEANALMAAEERKVREALFSHLPRVDDAEALAAVLENPPQDRDADADLYAGYTVAGDERWLVSVETDGEGKCMPEQLVAFTHFREEYPRLREAALTSILVEYRELRRQIADMRGSRPARIIMWLSGTPNLADLFPPIGNTAELAARLRGPTLRLHRRTKDGLAYFSLVYTADWDPEHEYDAIFLGDKLVTAGLNADIPADAAPPQE